MRLLKTMVTGVICFLGLFYSIKAEETVAKKTISGYIIDKKNGEKLIGATVYIQELKTGTSSNLYGFYSISLQPGAYHLEYSYVGYTSIKKTINLQEDKTMNVELAPSAKEIEEVRIEARRKNENIVSTEMSVNKLETKKIKQIPALLGEVDVIKAIQLLPGVQTASEGSSGFNVRGGAMDQNLILLDEAPVYNASHLMGFFSIFNNDAVKNIELYKGYIPPRAGGRLSSLLDIRMKEGNKKEFKVTGGIGIPVSSRLTVEGPIIKDKTSFIASGRRSYADLLLPLASDTNLHDLKLFFYDFNAKVNHTINQNNQIFLSGYFGRDIFKSEFARTEFGNQTLSCRWNHLFSKKIFSNLTFIRSKYDYQLGATWLDDISFLWTSNMTDYSLKADFTHYLNPQNTFKYGVHSILHNFDPGLIESSGEGNFLAKIELPLSKALESGIYFSNHHEISENIKLDYGIRYSFYSNIGKETIYDYESYYSGSDKLYQPVDTTVYNNWDFYHLYHAPEPRFALNYIFNERSSVKASYTRTLQYIHLASVSTAGTPLDIWFSSNPNIKPQKADQYTIGYFRNFFDDILETSIEVYYKKMHDVIDFRNDAQLLLNKHLTGELRFGEGEAYGIEFLFRKSLGKLTGWLSTTLSRTFRDIPEIAEDPFPAPYDKPVSSSLVLSYELFERMTFSCNFVYSTGRAVTFPTGKASYGGVVVPIYSGRNTYRYPDYHRMDIALTLKGKENPDRFWHGEWNFSIYNVYNRHNAWAINFVPDEDNQNMIHAEKTYLFPIIPSVTYNFKF